MIGAIVLAAGLSTRMGRPKHTLPWGETVIARRVVDVLAESGPDEIVVVTGNAREDVEAALRGSTARAVFNPGFANGSMLTSLQAGLRALEESACEVALVALGDQPQIEAGVVRAVIKQWRMNRPPILAPSFNGRRGHPILFARSFWPHIFSASSDLSPRDLLQAHAEQVVYLAVSTDSVLRDIDTPDDYEREARVTLQT
ncbi:MAG: nucleotidyltransferase family protein [Chloroflexi bacterium]|nr:nucleotidyltransferase family protein [Chloroflexota bacterium]